MFMPAFSCSNCELLNHLSQSKSSQQRIKNHSKKSSEFCEQTVKNKVEISMQRSWNLYQSICSIITKSDLMTKLRLRLFLQKQWIGMFNLEILKVDLEIANFKYNNLAFSLMERKKDGILNFQIGIDCAELLTKFIFKYEFVPTCTSPPYPPPWGGGGGTYWKFLHIPPHLPP